MTERVPSDQIEKIVGVERHPRFHYARAVSAEKKVLDPADRVQTGDGASPGWVVYGD